MKVQAAREHQGFKPLEVKLVFETSEELTAFTRIFNYTPITDYLPDTMGSTIRYAILTARPDVDTDIIELGKHLAKRVSL